jgi:branched-chain amino acid aminotransferase
VKVWLNGRLLDEEDACVSVRDRGLLLGDGVFETLRSHKGRLPTLTAHIERLEAGAAVLAIPVPPGDELARAARAVAREVHGEDARIRITVTSGSGPPGLGRGGELATVLVTATELPAWPAAASAVVAGWPHNERSPLAGVKTTSRADTVLALARARQEGVDEAIFLNQAGNLCEATTANVFLVIGGRVVTPPLSAGCLAGITRAQALALCAELGIDAVEADVGAHALAAADELFLTSSTRGIQPLVRLDGKPIGGGGAGPLTTRLADALGEAIAVLPDNWND